MNFKNVRFLFATCAVALLFASNANAQNPTVEVSDLGVLSITGTDDAEVIMVGTFSLFGVDTGAVTVRVDDTFFAPVRRSDGSILLSSEINGVNVFAGGGSDVIILAEISAATGWNTFFNVINGEDGSDFALGSEFTDLFDGGNDRDFAGPGIDNFID